MVGVAAMRFRLSLKALNSMWWLKNCATVVMEIIFFLNEKINISWKRGA